jgi:tripartite-type tricarboxylate transporter receptor subunit TctC
MTTTRRVALIAAAGSLAAPAIAGAQAVWPARPVTLINPYPPGGATDFGTRLTAGRMEPELGQPIVIESRPGAGTAVANAFVAGQRPDGYTLLMATTSLAVLPALNPASQPRDPLAALTPVGGATRSAFVLHVNPELPVRSTAELIAYVKANPGKVSFGSSGIGAINHMSYELFRARAGLDAVHVPYRGGAQALLDLQAGRVQAMFAATQEVVGSIREGKTRGLAVTSAARVAAVPELPPVADALPGYETLLWQGVFGPAGLPAPVVAKLGAALRVATADATVGSRLAAQGMAPWSADAAELRATLARELDMWTRLIREANLRAE